MAVERAFLDTNVLVAATDEARVECGQARSVLNQWSARGTALYVSGQILREYLVVATRPVEHNGLGLSRHNALRNALAFRERTRLLEETTKVVDRLCSLLQQVECTGKQIHDAQVVATMLAYGIRALVTTNVGDFKRFSDRIAIVDLRTT